MLPWIEQGLEASVRELSRLSGAEVKNVPYLGPRASSDAELAYVYAAGEVRLNTGDIRTRQRIADGWHVGLHHYYGLPGFKGVPGKPLVRTFIQDVVFEDHDKWASRSYLHQAWNAFDHCAIRRVENEHGIYHDVAGGGPKNVFAEQVTSSYFEDIGSQAGQYTQRSAMQGFDLSKYMTDGGPVRWKDVLVRDVGKNWGPNGRPGFAFSGHGREWRDVETGQIVLKTERAGYDIELVRVMIDISMQQTIVSKGYSCHGCYFIGERKRASLRGCVALSALSDRAVARFHKVDDVLLDGGFWHGTGGQAWVEFEDCGHVKITNAQGNLRVHLIEGGKTQDLGPIEQEYEIG